jgi:endonuclease III
MVRTRIGSAAMCMTGDGERRRGRPLKFSTVVARLESVEAEAGWPKAEADPPKAQPKKRGRPPKATKLAEADAESTEPQPKKRSRKAAGEVSSEPAASSSSSSSSSSPSKSSAAAIAPPPGWQSTWDLIVELRADRTAVVDSMGTEAISAIGDVSASERAYQALISLMLSSQTKDTINMATMKKLRAHQPGGLTVSSVSAMTDDTLHEYIRQVGFHNNKVRFIKETTRLLLERHEGEVPRTMDALLDLPGVGPKMAIILMRVAFDETVGISVDTHVHRICNQLGWAGAQGSKTPEKTRKVIEGWMPSHIWPDVNLLLVGLGQEVQTEKAKLIGKCLQCSDPSAALRLLDTLGVNVEKERAKHGL